MSKKISWIIFLIVELISCNVQEDNPSVVDTQIKDSLKKAPVSAITDSLYTGLVTEYYPKGEKKIEGFMKNGKRDGQWKSFYSDGALWSEGTYAEGKQYGTSISYYQNGNKQFEGLYKDGKPNGKWTFWDENGKVKKTMNYE